MELEQRRPQPIVPKRIQAFSSQVIVRLRGIQVLEAREVLSTMLVKALLGLVSASAVLATHSTVNIWLQSSWNAPPLILEVLYVRVPVLQQTVPLRLVFILGRVSRMKIRHFISPC